MRSECPLLAALLLTVAGSAAADLLVTREGATVETDGPWEVRGRMVVFTLPNGTLSSLRLSEVDLDKSQEATQHAAEQAAAPPPEEAPPEEREPVLVLTNDNVGRARPAPVAGEEATAEAASRTVRVVDWNLEALDGDPAFQLTGRLRNDSSTAATGIRLYLTVWAPDKSRAVGVDPVLDKNSLDPAETADFHFAFTRAMVAGSGFAEVFKNAKMEFFVEHDGARLPTP